MEDDTNMVICILISINHKMIHKLTVIKSLGLDVLLNYMLISLDK